ncbi:MAG: BON domain-containing protein [Rhodospirillaceae bacterium]|jgi:hyperosmotically inducible protein|nr:BON domain-containing protein [Rhodospirillaceae bacterium]MBT4687396.1 BON domain-containing protein [Rhodospirillaceae bacterium]MBT5079704.1 BON domain-containing protein [Rhodospirillaceae bacterium]MBT5523857.1 BON domain-containing protein [Rhodospirillaceae bacterium]MBT5882098.1 BON domain-containing protein [Rhodospirillaceae bacterium]
MSFGRSVARKILGGLFGAVLLMSTMDSAGAISLNPITAIKSAVEAAVEERSADDIGTDLKLKTKIVAEVFDKMIDDVISIGADVYEQDVMLTGAVEDAKTKARAGKLVRGIEGVKKVYNEILVIKPLDKDKGAVENFVDDTVIETKINALLLDATGVNVTNFRYRSINGHVFLFGRALSSKEKRKATAVARDIENVKSVKNLAKVRAKE